MKNYKLLFIIVITVIILIGMAACRLQEKMMFYPDVLSEDYKFSFKNKFQELYFKVDEKTKLNGLLFKSDKTKGLIFYLHGNAGANNSWGGIADVYLENNYDFFILDYRGYGKSQGKISSEEQMHRDIQIVYDSLKSMYAEKDIVIIGYSIGSGFAAKLASVNSPKTLILKAPYYSMEDLAHQYARILPKFLIRYKIKTNEFLTKVKCPVIIFHGDQDEVIDYGFSEKLQKHFKNGDTLITLEGQSHNGINENLEYINELKKILM